MSRILLVDDDKRLLSLLERGFRFEGFDVLLATGGDAALALTRDEHPDVMVLDIGMPGIDGFEVCRRLRTAHDMPVIVLTARDDVQDTVHALDLGADDYLHKPFAFDELLARVRALLRRRPGGPVGRLVFDDLTCDPGTREVTRGGRPVALTAREFDLLVHLMRQPRQVLTREAILQQVWGHDFDGDSKVVDVYVGYLRHKLGEPGLIQTVRGVGYALRR